MRYLGKLLTLKAKSTEIWLESSGSPCSEAAAWACAFHPHLQRQKINSLTTSVTVTKVAAGVSLPDLGPVCTERHHRVLTKSFWAAALASRAGGGTCRAPQLPSRAQKGLRGQQGHPSGTGSKKQSQDKGWKGLPVPV